MCDEIQYSVSNVFSMLNCADQCLVEVVEDGAVEPCVARHFYGVVSTELPTNAALSPANRISESI